jgi:hypothetical protein
MHEVRVLASGPVRLDYPREDAVEKRFDAEMAKRFAYPFILPSDCTASDPFWGSVPHFRRSAGQANVT